MLTTLRIKDLALVADLTLEFAPGLVVITGETGAGKTLLIGALNLVLGERADRTSIRAGCESCTVEAAFDVTRLRAPLAEWLTEHGLEPCDGHALLLKRTFTATGANRQFINGTPTTLKHLAALGEWLVDIHGPHDHQSLLHPARQLVLVDAYGGLEAPREAFAAGVRRRTQLAAEQAALVVDERTYAQQLDLLRFQVREIADARLQPDEEATLGQDYERARNAARLLELGHGALTLLAGEEASLLTEAGALGRRLQELQRVDAGAGCLLSLHEQAVASLQDLRSDLAHYVEAIDLDPARLEALEARMNLVQGLKRKYGATLAEVLAFGEGAAEKLRQLEGRAADLARIEAERARVDAELVRAGRALTAGRRQALPRLSKAVTRLLADLGFKQSRFDLALETARWEPGDADAPGLSGFDTVEYQFAPNPGEPARPLRAIASSGEMARVMLAIKTVLAAEDQIPVLVFDEVDANVGGETASVVGEKLRQIARQRQVLCVTHLAPVAACGSAHYVATKQVQAARTVTAIRRVDGEARVAELARMLGDQSDTARRHAAALLAHAAQ